MTPGEMIGATQEQEARAVKLFELSQLPEFQTVYDVLWAVGQDFFCLPPRRPEDVPAWTTFTYGDFFVRHIMGRIQHEIELGARLSNREEGEPHDAENDGHHPRRRA